MSTPAPVDIDVLRDEIQKTYTDVSERGSRSSYSRPAVHGPRTSAIRGDLLRAVPEATVESFAGVANHFTLGNINEGETVLDLGAGRAPTS